MTSSTDLNPYDEVNLTSLSEESMAEWRRHRGAFVVKRQDRHWERVARGFYQPVHWLARFSAEQIRRPRATCWGYRAVLQDHDLDHANGTLPVHLLASVHDYGTQVLSSNRRYHLRKCKKRASFRLLQDSSVLQQQGYAVMKSAIERTRHIPLPTEQAYLQSITDEDSIRHKLVFAGFIDGRLGGYLDGYAVDGTAYVDNVNIATEAMSSQMGTGLAFEFVLACQRSGSIREIVYGQHARENTSLDSFKKGMGFPVVHMPSRVWIHPLVRPLLRRRYPDKYYRLVGEEQ